MQRILPFIWCLLLVSCDQKTEEASSEELVYREPTKEEAVDTLNQVFTLLEKKDYETVWQMTHVRPKARKDQVMSELREIIDEGALSSKGIEILAEKGEWKKSEPAYPKSEQDTDPSSYAFWSLTLGKAGAYFYWEENQFKITKVRYIGDLEEES